MGSLGLFIVYMLLPNLDSVLDEAVRSYVMAKRRAYIQRTSAGRDIARDLATDYPDYYELGAPGDNLRFVGKSADEIIEDYLKLLGQDRSSRLWYSFSQIVVKRGESENDESI